MLTSVIGFPLMLSLHAVGMAVSMGLILVLVLVLVLVLDLRLLGRFNFVSYVFLRRALVVAWLQGRLQRESSVREWGVAAPVVVRFIAGAPCPHGSALWRRGV